MTMLLPVSKSFVLYYNNMTREEAREYSRLYHEKHKLNPEYQARRRANELKRKIRDPHRYIRYSDKHKNNLEFKLKRNLLSHQRREKLRLGGNPVILSYDELMQIYTRDEYKCLCCGATDKIQLDHIIPVSCGGLTTLDNIQLLCKTCNLSKKAKIIDYRKPPSKT